MRLTLDPYDLQPAKRQNFIVSTLAFADFKPEVQAAIVAVGKATFYNWQGDNHQTIYLPKGETHE